MSAAPMVSVKVSANDCGVPEALAPRAGLKVATEIVPAGVKGTCHTPSACQPVLFWTESRAAR